MGPKVGRYDETKADLRSRPKRWLITGAAGFIGSNLLEALLRLDQTVVGLDDYATGHRRNLDEVRAQVTAEQYARFRMIDGDIREIGVCTEAVRGVDYVLHQAALGSVPRSINDPVTTNSVNVDGFLNILVAARDAAVERFVYASSSSIYGDDEGLPKVEHAIGRAMSPYAVTKLVNETYAAVFSRTYDIDVIGLRYFNVFGRRQDPDGAYAAVIPRWIAAALTGAPVEINGDGETSRDFCYVENVVQANLLAATAARRDATNQIYNIAVGDRTTLNQLLQHIRDILAPIVPAVATLTPVYTALRKGDVRHSVADIGKARRLLEYEPSHGLSQGLSETIAWYAQARGISSKKMAG
jgi:UDP-N-acetylglucosamine/UDP-N-acetylgalactosamine 4-epimerase